MWCSMYVKTILITMYFKNGKKKESDNSSITSKEIKQLLDPIREIFKP